MEWGIIAALVGASFGSFYNVVAYRLPRGMSIVSPPSHCPACKSTLRWYHNIPVISYLFLRGKCAFCSYKVPIRYFLVELFSAFLAVFCYFRWGLSVEALLMFVFFSLLLIGSLIDFETFTIPDFVTLGGLLLGILSSPFRSSGLFDSFLGALLGGGSFLAIYLFYVKVRKIEGLGFGDVKLMAMIG
ncbi:MAG: prepilin peptidase, partial [Aquificaceae bacterium]|nr:prepilin peptidase [Aquificaceae bacterium]